MRWLWLMAGILSIIGGFVALANPFKATLAAEWLAGWAFIFSGVMVVISAFVGKSERSWVMTLIVGVFLLLLGVFLLANPLQGIISLTVMVACFLIAAGIARVFWGIQNGGNVCWALIISGGLSLVLGLMVFGNFASAATTLLGILLGVELISNGISLIAVFAMGKEIKAE